MLGRVYQRTLSHVVPVRCRFYPSCSHYYLQAIEVYGPWRGLLLAVQRLLRCQPLCRPGYDPVPIVNTAAARTAAPP